MEEEEAASLRLLSLSVCPLACGGHEEEGGRAALGLDPPAQVLCAPG